jgi:hypothetical protein
MRTSLFLSTLAVVTLVGGAAFAEKGVGGHQSAREPKMLDFHRTHGDMVDKSYRHDAKPAGRGESSGVSQLTGGSKTGLSNPGQSRVSCSTDAMDCPNKGSKAGHVAAPSDGSSKAQLPATKGNENQFGQRSDARYNCNEGDECSASSKAAKHVWANHGASAGNDAGAGKGTLPSLPSATSRLLQQNSTPRAAAGDDGESYMSSKAAKQSWAYSAVKAGTFEKAVDTTGAYSASKALENRRANARHDTGK